MKEQSRVSVPVRHRADKDADRVRLWNRWQVLGQLDWLGVERQGYRVGQRLRLTGGKSPDVLILCVCAGKWSVIGFCESTVVYELM